MKKNDNEKLLSEMLKPTRIINANEKDKIRGILKTAYNIEPELYDEAFSLFHKIYPVFNNRPNYFERRKHPIFNSDGVKICDYYALVKEFKEKSTYEKLIKETLFNYFKLDDDNKIYKKHNLLRIILNEKMAIEISLKDDTYLLSILINHPFN